MVQVWKDKTCANDKYDPWHKNCKQMEDRKTNMEIKKPYAVVQYNKFIKDVERAEKYLSYYSILK